MQGKQTVDDGLPILDLLNQPHLLSKKQFKNVYLPLI